MFTIITVIIILAAVLLIVAVLLQSGKGEGLASNFTAGNQTFGVRQTADLLEKITWVLVAVIIVLSIITSFVIRPSHSSNTIKDDIESTERTLDENPTNNPTPASTLEIENPAAESENPQESKTE